MSESWKSFIAIIGLVIFVGGAEARAQINPPVPKTNPPQPHYLTGKEAVWSNFPKAPVLGSPVDQTDLLITLAAQNAPRTEDQKAEATKDKDYSIALMTDVIDPAYATNHKATAALLQSADDDAYFITTMLKHENKRLRPFAQHPTLVTPLFTAKDYSYPSGHSSGTELQARILCLLFKDRAADLLNRARQVADGRVIAGVHYASDTEAGQKLGDMLFDELEKSPKFTKALDEAAKVDGLTVDHSPIQ